jgi:hypothetical protein
MTSHHAFWRRRDRNALPKMTIRPQLPWQLRASLITIALLLCVLAVWLSYGLGRGQTSGHGLAQQVQEMNNEREKLLRNANAAESKSTIERAAQAQLSKQVKLLEAENNRLKEDLAFFESLMPASGGPRSVNIRRLNAEIVAGNQLRYRILVMQGGKRDAEFVGTLQLAVMGLQAAKNVTILFPDPKAQGQEYQIGFKHYQRLEGVLTVPEGMQIKGLSARVLENGQIRTQQSLNL